jgi:drug/metabolite transporter (DMT)-like permease
MGQLRLFLLLFLTGKLSDVAVFGRHETLMLVLAAAGGYGFWVLRGLALESARIGQARLLFNTVPLLIGLFSLVTFERATPRTFFWLVWGFVGCIMLLAGFERGGVQGSITAVGAAACWAAFTLRARALVREESVLPVAFLVTAIGAGCLFVTCLSTGANVFDVSGSQLVKLLTTGVFTVGLMMAFWLKAVAAGPAVAVAPAWYFGLLFGALWPLLGGRGGSWWWFLGGAVLIVLSAHGSRGAREKRKTVSVGDIIRASGEGD